MDPKASCQMPIIYSCCAFAVALSLGFLFLSGQSLIDAWESSPNLHSHVLLNS